LFFLKASGSVGAAIVQAVIMLVLLGITALAQLLINHSFNRRSFDLLLANAHGWYFSHHQLSTHVPGYSRGGA
jgi:hypothetical protein